MSKVTCEWLKNQLRKPNVDDFILILDCRLQSEYLESHIKGSLNFFLPSIILRRLHQKKLELFATIKCRNLKSRIMSNYSTSKNGKFTFVLYNGGKFNVGNNEISSFSVLKQILEDDSCTFVQLEGGFSAFLDAYPELCESDCVLETDFNTTDQLIGLRSLRISTPITDSTETSSNESSDCESSGLTSENQDPVEILPWLYLGNASHSEDSQALQKLNIRYVLNVTPDLPNVFERAGKITYLQIPITDHWSQDLSIHFPRAIKFIEDARANNSAVLVHCLAGVSRSVTITLAYLMYARSLCLNDAFAMVRIRKPDISPNFQFLQQLDSWENQLKKDPTRAPIQGNSAFPGSSLQNFAKHLGRRRHKYECSCLEFDCKCVADSLLVTGPFQSPDSGIEFDRWSSENTPK